jgi:hypothetical protein
MTKKRIFISLGLFLIAFIIAGLLFYRPLKPANQPSVDPITKDKEIVKCKEGDKACEEKNEKIKVNKIEGINVDFAKHQCSGPRACPTPNENTSSEAITAIRIFAKDSKVELLRIAGINSLGLVYYCANDSRCWSYDTKSKKVTLLQNKEEKSASPSASLKKN